MSQSTVTEKRTVISSSSSGYDMDDIPYKSSLGSRPNIISRSTLPMHSSGGTQLVRTMEYNYGTSMGGMGPAGFSNVSNTGVTNVKNTREKEKKDMRDLNERFANYIEKVRFLEAQNRKLGGELDELRSKWGKETSHIKQMYEAELTEARKLIDDLSKDKAALEIKSSSISEQNADLQRQLDDAKKYRQQDRDQINKLNQQLADYESEINMLRRSIESLETERSRDRATINRLQQEVDKGRIDLNNETLSHLDAENRRQTLEEEMEFMKKVHEQELKELAALAYRDTTAENREFWKSELAQAIRDIQSEYDSKVDQLRNDMEAFYNLKIQEYRTGATKQNMEVTHIREENKKMIKQMSELRGKLTDMEARNAQLEKQYQEVLRELENKEADHMMETTQLREEISKLRAEMEGILAELQTLMDAKLSLELEIAAYRKLLEGEENRIDWRSRATMIMYRDAFRPRSTFERSTRDEVKEKIVEPKTEQVVSTKPEQHDASPDTDAASSITMSDQDLSPKDEVPETEMTELAEDERELASKEQSLGQNEKNVGKVTTDTTEPPSDHVVLVKEEIKRIECRVNDVTDGTDKLESNAAGKASPVVEDIKPVTEGISESQRATETNEKKSPGVPEVEPEQTKIVQYIETDAEIKADKSSPEDPHIKRAPENETKPKPPELETPKPITVNETIEVKQVAESEIQPDSKEITRADDKNETPITTETQIISDKSSVQLKTDFNQDKDETCPTEQKQSADKDDSISKMDSLEKEQQKSSASDEESSYVKEGEIDKKYSSETAITESAVEDKEIKSGETGTTGGSTVEAETLDSNITSKSKDQSTDLKVNTIESTESASQPSDKDDDKVNSIIHKDTDTLDKGAVSVKIENEPIIPEKKDVLQKTEETIVSQQRQEDKRKQELQEPTNESEISPSKQESSTGSAEIDSLPKNDESQLSKTVEEQSTPPKKLDATVDTLSKNETDKESEVPMSKDIGKDSNKLQSDDKDASKLKPESISSYSPVDEPLKISDGQETLVTDEQKVTESKLETVSPTKTVSPSPKDDTESSVECIQSRKLEDSFVSESSKKALEMPEVQESSCKEEQKVHESKVEADKSSVCKDNETTVEIEEQKQDTKAADSAHEVPEETPDKSKEKDGFSKEEQKVPSPITTTSKSTIEIKPDIKSPDSSLLELRAKSPDSSKIQEDSSSKEIQKPIESKLQASTSPTKTTSEISQDNAPAKASVHEEILEISKHQSTLAEDNQKSDEAKLETDTIACAVSKSNSELKKDTHSADPSSQKLQEESIDISVGDQKITESKSETETSTEKTASESGQDNVTSVQSDMSEKIPLPKDDAVVSETIQLDERFEVDVKNNNGDFPKKDEDFQKKTSESLPDHSKNEETLPIKKPESLSSEKIGRTEDKVLETVVKSKIIEKSPKEQSLIVEASPSKELPPEPFPESENKVDTKVSYTDVNQDEKPAKPEVSEQAKPADVEDDKTPDEYVKKDINKVKDQESQIKDDKDELDKPENENLVKSKEIAAPLTQPEHIQEKPSQEESQSLSCTEGAQHAEQTKHVESDVLLSSKQPDESTSERVSEVSIEMDHAAKQETVTETLKREEKSTEQTLKQNTSMTEVQQESHLEQTDIVSKESENVSKADTDSSSASVSNVIVEQTSSVEDKKATEDLSSGVVALNIKNEGVDSKTSSEDLKSSGHADRESLVISKESKVTESSGESKVSKAVSETNHIVNGNAQDEISEQDFNETETLDKSDAPSDKVEGASEAVQKASISTSDQLEPKTDITAERKQSEAKVNGDDETNTKPGVQTKDGLNEKIEKLLLNGEDAQVSMKMMRGEVSAKTTYQKTSTGPVAINEVAADGKYIVVENTSAGPKRQDGKRSAGVDVNLDGWQLKRTVDGLRDYIYKFRNFTLKPGKTVKILARGAASEAGLNDLVFRDDETWGFGAQVKTCLINDKGEEKASHVQKTLYN